MRHINGRKFEKGKYSVKLAHSQGGFVVVTTGFRDDEDSEYLFYYKSEGNLAEAMFTSEVERIQRIKG